MKTCVGYKIENIVGKVENAGYQHFLLLPPCFPSSLQPGCLTQDMSDIRSIYLL